MYFRRTLQMSGTETATSGAGSTSGYAHPEALVETGWVAEHLNNPTIRIIEADEDVLLYELGHVPGAVKLDWDVDVQDPVSRDFVDQQGFEKLMSHWGISNDTTIVLYFFFQAEDGIRDVAVTGVQTCALPI